METKRVQRCFGRQGFKSIYVFLLIFMALSTYLYTDLVHCRRLIAGLKTQVIEVSYGKRIFVDEIENKLLFRNKLSSKNTDYFSIKPEHCVQTGMRQHCMWAVSNRIGVNQHRELKMACYPEEVVLSPPIPTIDPNFPPRKEMLAIEAETLNDPEFVDILNTTYPKLSTFKILGEKKQYTVGDVIKVRIDMVDGHKKPRTVGGDDVRMLMRSSDGTMGIAGSVEDLKNGTYLGSIKLLWPGISNVYVLLPFTRESRATAFKWRREYKEIFYYYGKFAKEKLNEYTLCSPYPVINGYKQICNFTKMNHDYPWFCGQPLNPGLACGDFVMANDLDYLEIPMTAAQRATFDRHSTNVKISGDVQVNVIQGPKQSENTRPPCNKLSPKDTWNFTMPYGYFDHGQWISLNCQNTLTKANVLEHLWNTTLVIVGDSTTRQWYTSLIDAVHCEQETKAWTTPKWYDISSCYVKKVNFRVHWYPHVFPFPNGKKEKNGKMNLKSVRQALMEVPAEGKYLFVFHHNAHFIRQHYTLFRDVVRSLKPAIRDALKRNPDVKIAIKSPHSFHKHPCPSHLSDFAGPLFMDILKSELEEFHNSVWLLNYWEQTLVLENADIHPEGWVVWENIRTFIGYTLR